MQPSRNQRAVPPRGSERPERIVAGEHLVAAVAAERNRHVPPGERRQQVCQDNRAVAERLVEPREHARNELDRFIEIEDIVMVVGVKQVGDPRRVRRLVVRLLMESDRERVGLFRWHVPRRER